MKRWIRFFVVLLAFILLAAHADRSWAFPERPVSIIVSVAPGAGPDVIARILADQLGRRWNKQVLIVNRPGGNGSIAAQAAALSPADGYTLHIALSSGYVVVPETSVKWPVDLTKDFVTVGLIGEQPMAVAVSRKLGITSFTEFLALARQQPDQLIYGASRLSVPHMSAELLNLRAGIKLRYVPTTGAAKVVQDVMSGNLQVFVDSIPGMAGALQSGDLVGLALASDTILKSHPDIPLASDAVPGFQAKGWFVLLAPVKTPDSVVAQIRSDLRTVLLSLELQRRFEGVGTFARTLTVEGTEDFIKAEKDHWRPIVRQVAAEQH